MLLAADVGNTQIVVGAFDHERLVCSWRLSSRPGMTADEIVALLDPLLTRQNCQPDASVMASVVPPLTEQVCRALERLTGSSPLQIEPGVKTGLRIRTDNPHEVGADRIVNAVAGFTRYGGPVVIVDFGTTTNLDVVTAAGDYLGGVIAPGPGIGAEALSARAARLPGVQLSVPEHVIGRNTIDAICSGLMYGQAGSVDGFVRRIEQELGEAPRVVATGGLAPVIGPLLARLDGTDPDLTLDGLRIVYERNTEKVPSREGTR